jgi:hypothetical protein
LGNDTLYQTIHEFTRDGSLAELFTQRYCFIGQSFGQLDADAVSTAGPIATRLRKIQEVTALNLSHPIERYIPGRVSTQL